MGAHPVVSLLAAAFISFGAGSSSAYGQQHGKRLTFEVGAGAFLPTRALSSGAYGSTGMSAAPTATAALIVRAAPTLVLRLRGIAALDGGTTTEIVSGPGTGKSSDPGGRLWAGLAETILELSRHPGLEIGAGLGARRYSFPQDDCAGPCGTGDRSNTALAASLNAAVTARMGGRLFALEASSLLSRYSGRTMHDVLIGFRLRF